MSAPATKIKMDLEEEIQIELDNLAPHIEITDSIVGNFLVYKNDNVISKAITLFGEYCHAEVRVLSNFLKEPECIYLDIGTNIGFHAVAIAKLTNCQVLGFEPNFKHFSIAAYNSKNYPNVQLINRAVSNREESFFMKDFDASQSSNYGDIHIADEGKETKSIVLDKMQINRCHVMKIDVEGHEYEVLLGATKLISRARPIIMYEAMEYDVWTKCYDFLSKKKYRQYWVACKTFPIAPTYKQVEDQPFGASTISNILSIPAEKLQPDYLIEVIEGEPFKECFERCKKLQVVF